MECLLGNFAVYTQKHPCWERALSWLNSIEHQFQTTPPEHAVDLVDDCCFWLDDIPCDGVMPCLSPAVHLTAPDLAIFLSNAWLNNTMINAGAHYVLTWLNPASQIGILNCQLIVTLSAARRRQDHYFQ